MKKLLTLLSLAALTISATFATTSTSNINVGGYVSPISYSFGLKYKDSFLTSGNAISDSFNLAVGTQTSDFIVTRSTGNLNNDLLLTVSVQANSFKGSFNGNATYDTQITPQIAVVTNTYTYAETPVITTDKKNATFKILIPAGAQETDANLGAFNLMTIGNSSVPAGSFTSVVNVSYTYEQ